METRLLNNYNNDFSKTKQGEHVVLSRRQVEGAHWQNLHLSSVEALLVNFSGLHVSIFKGICDRICHNVEPCMVKFL